MAHFTMTASELKVSYIKMTPRIFYRIFKALSSIKHWGLYRFTPAGLFAVAALIAAATLGLDTNQTVAYQVFTLLLSILAVSFATTIFRRQKFSVSRSLPRHVTAGKKFDYVVTVKNETDEIQDGYSFTDEFADPRPTYSQFIATRSMKGLEGDFFAKGVGYLRWARLIADNERAVASKSPLFVIDPGGEYQIPVEIIPLKRGYLHFTGAAISRTDIFGMMKTNFFEKSEETVLVIPKIYKTPPFSLASDRKYHLGGVALATSVGDSTEFVSLRDYLPGDPIRTIHWKSWAKTGKPVVRENQEEFFSRHALILDTFPAGGADEQFEDAVSVAASFVTSMETEESLLELMFIGDKAYSYTAGRGIGAATKMLEILACVTLCEDKGFCVLRNRVIERLPMLSACIIVLQSWDEERKNFIGELKAYGAELKVILIHDGPAPDDFDLGPMKASPGNFHVLKVGNIELGLLQL